MLYKFSPFDVIFRKVYTFSRHDYPVLVYLTQHMIIYLGGTFFLCGVIVCFSFVLVCLQFDKAQTDNAIFENGRFKSSCFAFAQHRT